jgi:hypothetical protein
MAEPLPREEAAQVGETVTDEENTAVAGTPREPAAAEGEAAANEEGFAVGEVHGEEAAPAEKAIVDEEGASLAEAPPEQEEPASQESRATAVPDAASETLPEEKGSGPRAPAPDSTPPPGEAEAMDGDSGVAPSEDAQTVEAADQKASDEAAAEGGASAGETPLNDEEAVNGSASVGEEVPVSDRSDNPAAEAADTVIERSLSPSGTVPADASAPPLLEAGEATEPVNDEAGSPESIMGAGDQENRETADVLGGIAPTTDAVIAKSPNPEAGTGKGMPADGYEISEAAESAASGQAADAVAEQTEAIVRHAVAESPESTDVQSPS